MTDQNNSNASEHIRTDLVHQIVSAIENNSPIGCEEDDVALFPDVEEVEVIHENAFEVTFSDKKKFRVNLEIVDVTEKNPEELPEYLYACVMDPTEEQKNAPMLEGDNDFDFVGWCNKEDWYNIDPGQDLTEIEDGFYTDPYYSRDVMINVEITLKDAFEYAEECEGELFCSDGVYVLRMKYNTEAKCWQPDKIMMKEE
jgi:hypothetical protein